MVELLLDWRIVDRKGRGEGLIRQCPAGIGKVLVVS